MLHFCLIDLFERKMTLIVKKVYIFRPRHPVVRQSLCRRFQWYEMTSIAGSLLEAAALVDWQLRASSQLDVLFRLRYSSFVKVSHTAIHPDCCTMRNNHIPKRDRRFFIYAG
jgi:hypothetical protein